jgi:hypothetical protein
MTENTRDIHKKSVDDIRASLEASGNPSSDEVMNLINKIKLNKPTLNIGKLFPLFKAIRGTLKKVNPEWLFQKGIKKAVTIRNPGAIIISDSLELQNEDMLKALDGCIYVRKNRALYFFTDSKLVLCDIRACEPDALAKKYNSTTIEKMQLFLQSQNFNNDAEKKLESLILQAKGFSFEYADDDEPDIQEDHDEKKGFFKCAPDVMLEEMRQTAAWEQWLENASEQEIEQELNQNPDLLERLVKMYQISDIDQELNNSKKRLLRLVKKNDTHKE